MALAAAPTTKPPLTRSERLRRGMILCRDFTRNLGYVRGAQKHPAGWKELPLHPAVNFYRIAHNNALDMCVLDWCKLFGDDKAKHYWGKIVSNPARFEGELLQSLNINAADFEAYLIEMRTYRDRFLAHLDSDLVAHISDLELARQTVEFYYGYIVANEVQPGDLANLPVNVTILRFGYEECER